MESDGPKIEIRHMVSTEDMESCVQLQQEVWQFRELDVVPRRTFVVANAVGGHVFGAWHGDRLVGYALAIPGLRTSGPYLHSHMLAVLEEYRSRGVGKRLKLAQREDALARGIDLIEWTFDPLEIRNAYFNIEKLGAIVRRYTSDFYGPSTSPLHGFLPTDRMHAEWWVKSERVQASIAEQQHPQPDIKETITVPYISAQPGDTLPSLPALALQSRLELRRRFSVAFSAGLTVLKFLRTSGEAGCYGLGYWNDAGRTIEG